MDWSYLAAGLLGVAFGIALNKGGLTRYRNIVGVFRFTNLTVIKFMMSAMLTAMIGLYGLKSLGVLNFPNVPATFIVGNLVGGLIFGAGMALTGYCPGTVAAGAGEGQVDYLVAGFSGMLVGAGIFGFAYPAVYPPLAKIAALGNVTLPDLWGLNPLLVVFAFALLTLLLFYGLERGLKRRDRLEE